MAKRSPEDQRYYDNSKSVEILGRRYGFVLVSFNPTWTVCQQVPNRPGAPDFSMDSSRLTDGLMRSVALANCLPWSDTARPPKKRASKKKGRAK